MKSLFNKMFLFGLLVVSSFAQDSSAEKQSEVAESSKFLEIILDNPPIGPLIWGLIFLLSAASFSSIITNLLTVRRKFLLPPKFIDEVIDAMQEGDLDQAIELCENNNSPVSNILMTGFASIDAGFAAVEDAVSSTTQVEVEKLMQKVGALNLYGQLAPMLGLLGTVTGMVAAFDSLGSSEGAEKAQLLGLAISQALWTTCGGLLIAIPAIYSYTLIRNKAVKILLESETIVVNLLKDLRDVEIEDE